MRLRRSVYISHGTKTFMTPYDTSDIEISMTTLCSVIWELSHVSTLFFVQIAQNEESSFGAIARC
jgi:hypothetical protein